MATVTCSNCGADRRITLVMSAGRGIARRLCVACWVEPIRTVETKQRSKS